MGGVLRCIILRVSNGLAKSLETDFNETKWIESSPEDMILSLTSFDRY